MGELTRYIQELQDEIAALKARLVIVPEGETQEACLHRTKWAYEMAKHDYEQASSNLSAYLRDKSNPLKERLILWNRHCVKNKADFSDLVIAPTIRKDLTDSLHNNGFVQKHKVINLLYYYQDAIDYVSGLYDYEPNDETATWAIICEELLTLGAETVLIDW
jgi:hypothetical protein